MVDIFSKSDGPRREDEKARRVIHENRATIARLADQISGGGYSAAQAARRATGQAAPVAAGPRIHDFGAGGTSAAPRPYIRVSPNNRVVVVDAGTGRQMHFLGEIRRVGGARRFVLATRENRFFSPVDEEIGAALADLDGCEIAGGAAEEGFAREIGSRLGVD